MVMPIVVTSARDSECKSEFAAATASAAAVVIVIVILIGVPAV